MNRLFGTKKKAADPTPAPVAEPEKKYDLVEQQQKVLDHLTLARKQSQRRR